MKPDPTAARPPDLAGAAPDRADTARHDADGARLAAVANAPAVLFAVDRAGLFTLFEGRGVAALGLRPGEAVGRAVREVFPDAPRLVDGLRRALAGDVAIVTAEIGGVVCEVRCAPIRDDGGTVTGVSGLATDVTARAQAEEVLRRRVLTFENTSDGVLIADLDGRIVDWNPAAERMFGFGHAAMLGQTLAILYAGDDAEAASRAAFEEMLRRGRWTDEVAYRREDGTAGVREAVFLPLRGATGAATAAFVVAHDITERKAFEELLAHQAFHDPLTALPNRALFLDRLEHALAREDRTGGAVAVLFLDLDRFKAINDSLGHEAGDQLLVAVATRLRECVRPQDTVARLGGDEFTILLEDLHDAGEAVRVTERLLARLHIPFDLGSQEVALTSSIGIAVAAGGARPPQELLRDADIAMYRAKASGRAGYAVFEDSMSAGVVDRLRLEADLRRAIARDDLRVHYQPLVALDSGRIAGFEALLRWEHPQRGPIAPDRFIPLAEETGLILPIGGWALEEACWQARAWREGHRRYPTLAIAVNLSDRQFHHPHLLAEVTRVLGQTGFDPTGLILEIAESTVMADVGESARVLQQLRDYGIRLAIDDFGAGSSTLSHLRQFPVDILKIDRSFTGRLGQSQEDDAIVEAIVTLARTLGLRVVAEGVATVGQLARLRALGCDLGQGYHFARALPASDAGELLERPPFAVPALSDAPGAAG